MASNINKCNICGKRTQTHDPTLLCNICQTKIHINCLPIYLDKDITYASNPDNQWSCTKCLQEIFPFSDLDSTCLQSFTNESTYYDVDLLNKQMYDPTETNGEEE